MGKFITMIIVMDIFKVEIFQSESDEFEKPSYFQLLTCMMYYAFVKEKVDVAIVEVGIGGQYDCTNIVRYFIGVFMII